MGDNICCPYLKTLKYSDIKDQRYFICGTDRLSPCEKAQKDYTVDNEWVKIFCMVDFKECKYFPKGDKLNG